jgi:uncharacterized membrane protein (UPF0127 family)
MIKKSKSMRFLAVILIVIVCLGVYFIENKKQTGVEISKACFRQQCFDVEIAQTAVERQTGLMFRESLCNDCGMLFMFEQPGAYSFWMKNTLIPLDIIWIDKNKEVLYIKENAQPCKVENCESFTTDNDEASYVLEINAGAAEKHNISIGDKVKFE